MSEEEILYENLKQLIPDIGSLSRVRELRQFKGSIDAMRQYSESKDQQIKDLESLLWMSDRIIKMSTDVPQDAYNTYKNQKQSYQQKYPKQ